LKLVELEAQKNKKHFAEIAEKKICKNQLCFKKWKGRLWLITLLQVSAEQTILTTMMLEKIKTCRIKPVSNKCTEGSKPLLHLFATLWRKTYHFTKCFNNAIIHILINRCRNFAINLSDWTTTLFLYRAKRRSGLKLQVQNNDTLSKSDN